MGHLAHLIMTQIWVDDPNLGRFFSHVTAQETSQTGPTGGFDYLPTSASGPCMQSQHTRGTPREKAAAL